MLSDENDHRDLIDLIEQMLVYEPEKRFDQILTLFLKSYY